MINHFSKSLAILVLLLVSHTSQAGLIEQRTWQNANDLVYVEDTNLEWLLPSLTAGMTYTTLLPELQVNGKYYGFKIASYEQSVTLFKALNIFDLQNTVVRDDIKQYVELFGDVMGSVNDRATGSSGLVDINPDGEFMRVGAWFIDDSYFDNTDCDFLGGTCQLYGADETQAYLGFHLVRSVNSTQVPEPGSFTIFALGIMGLAFRKYKKSS